MKKCESFPCQNEAEKNFCSDPCRLDALLSILNNAVSFFGWAGARILVKEAELLIAEYTPKDDIAKSCDPRPHMPEMVRFPDMHRDGLD